MTVRYQDLAADEYYQNEWTINPVDYEGEPFVGGVRGVEDLVEVVEKISEDLEELVRSRAEAGEDGTWSREGSSHGH